jgi:WD40 repeat protein
MYGQAVLAVTFSTCGNYIASSSTDHTIRIFDLQQEEERLRQKKNSEKKRTRLRQGPVQNWDPRGLYDETEGGNSHDADNDQDDDNNEETSVSICISAGHAYCLSFSPDDVFLVSGHHLSEPRRGGGAGGTAAGAARAFPSETISIWDVSTGQLLRAIRGGGMPVSFIDSSAILPCPSSSSWSSQKSVKLVSTSSDDCLKMWNLNHTIHDSTNNSTSISSNSLLRLSRERERSPDNNGRCVRRWFLGSYNTVMPCPKPDDCENIIVASIDEKAPNSFSIWNTADPTNRRSFKNISPYEIRISSNGTKVASVDDFCTVKVWRISDGRLLSTFDGFGWGVGTRSDGIISASSSRQSDLLEPVDSEVDVDVGATSATSGWFNRLSSLSSLDGDGDGDDDNNSTSDDDSDDGSITSRSDEFCSPALGPACISGGIHEIAFAKDDTVAVISRHFNEIYLFST